VTTASPHTTRADNQFSSFVYGLALRVIGDARAAEDVSQEVFVTVWERSDAFDPDRGSFRTWLGTLTHRRAVDHVRREEARRRRAVENAARAHSTPDVEEMAMALVIAERVRSALATLPDEQRRAIQLAYFAARRTGKWPRCSGSRRERPSRACAWACAASPVCSTPKPWRGTSRSR
jgi:RNA polymerase sigma factor (sigma-70 family)